MVLTRGCASRLTVLTGSGNLRALSVLVVFAIVAHATLRGVLAPLRTMLATVTLHVGGALPMAVGAILVGLALALAWRGRLSAMHLAGGIVIGLLVPAAWVGTGLLLADDFDPIPMEALSFSLPAAETLFWVIASSAIAPTFGAGLFLGTLAGAAAAAILGRRFQWQSFSTPRETGRYGAGAVLMGFGGVLAGGCTLGAGLSGVPTLSVAAVLTLAAIASGALLTDRMLSAAGRAPAAQAARPPA